MKYKYIAALLIPAFLGACATPEVVSERQGGDASLNCKQLAREVSEAEKFAERARYEIIFPAYSYTRVHSFNLHVPCLCLDLYLHSMKNLG